ncbi:MAG: fructose-bisphosphate aldolase [Planctomyces sp.]|nr:fructose-bisphosphate aldolase [Planctomyces sp.]
MPIAHVTPELPLDAIVRELGEEAEDLLGHQCTTISADQLTLPGGDFIDRVWMNSDRNPAVLRSMQQLFDHGRLAGSGYLSILPVDQGVEHSAGASFAPNPIYFDPEQIVKLAVEGGCNAVASTFGVLASVARRYAHKIPFLVKLNHNELLSSPNQYDQVMFAQVEDAWNMGAVGVGATIYFGSVESRRQLQEVSEAFSRAHDLGMFTVLWCYLRNPDFKVKGTNYETSADLTGQANHLGATLGADFLKQKQPTNNGGYAVLNEGEQKFGKFDQRMYDNLATDHLIDLTRYQVLNGYAGRCGLINSGGASGANDFQQALRTAVINKRAGGMGLISGRKAFQRPMHEGIRLLNGIQDVYLHDDIKVA